MFQGGGKNYKGDKSPPHTHLNGEGAIVNLCAHGASVIYIRAHGTSVIFVHMWRGMGMLIRTCMINVNLISVVDMHTIH